jgi:hypothetical protein
MTTHGSFYGGESTLLQSNVFKIYVADGGLHFARVADRFYKELLESGQPNALLFGAGGAAMKHGVMQPAVRKQAELEARYDALEPGTADFIGVDKRNFSIRSGEVLQAKLAKVTTMTQGPGRVGFLELQTNNGKKRRFTLTSSLSPQEIEQLIRKALPSVEGSLL